MTREEQTISNLKKLKSYHNGSYGADIDRAIKALERDDAISRKEVLNTIRDWWGTAMMADGEPTLCDSIRDLPLVTPQQQKIDHWIPVSERLPEKNGNYLVTYEAFDRTARLRYQAVDHYGPDWLHESKHTKALAWMPLPEPYDPQESEDKE